MSVALHELETRSRLIGLSGTINSGVNTAAKHLADLGFVRQELTVISPQASDSELSTAGTQTEIDNWPECHDQYRPGLVVSGIASLDDARHIKEVGGKLIFIDADKDIRRRRLIGHLVIDELEQADNPENMLVPMPTKQPELAAIKSIGDVRLYNNDSKATFIDWIDYLLARGII